MLHQAQENKNKNVQREPLGERDIDRHQVVGFRIRAAAARRRSLGRSENRIAGPPSNGNGMDGKIEVTISDFVFNAEMDESLFSVKLPAGYTVRTPESRCFPDAEKDVIEMLRNQQLGQHSPTRSIC